MAADMTCLPHARSLLPRLPKRSNLRVQRGFSLVEMLLAAVILAVGLLGLAMLQAMSLKASKGSANAAAAALLAGQIMDRAELEGRLSWLNITDSNRISLGLDDLHGFGLKYITIKSGEKLEEEFDARGGQIDPKAADTPDAPNAAARPFFRATTRRATVPGGTGTVGQMSDISVRVEYSDSAGGNKKPIVRAISLTRRIVHG
jgi:prepilin-type N-terminal cleavage/methylation domain-containing protein